MAAFRRSGLSWLALLALALQLALSFGHTHSHAPLAAGVTLTHSQASDSPSPTPLRGEHKDEQHCSICWATAIAGALVLAAPIAVLLPAPHSPPAPAVLGTLQDRASIKFQARGPPSPTIA
jgi:hypothetical protein